MESATPERSTGEGRPAVVVCITDVAEDRSRLAAQFDGPGVLVIASDTQVASAFLGQLGHTGSDAQPPPDDLSVLHIGDVRLDLDLHQASWHDRSLPLTPYELKVLACLADHPGRIWTYRQLHDRAWNGSYFTGPAAVQSVIKRLRAKLRRAGLPLHIHAARGLGFRVADGNDLHLVNRAR